MAIRRLDLADFTVFESSRFAFDPGINVFIGPNGTGKTHVLKLLYAICKVLEDGDIPPTRIAAPLADKLGRVFRPDGNRVGRLVRRVQGKALSKVAVQFDDGSFRFSLHQTNVDPIRQVTRTRVAAPRAIYLPSREVLSLFEGFSALYAAREIAVDETYADAMAALDLPALRGARPGVLGEVARDLEQAIGAKVRRDGPRFYLRESSGAKIEAHLAAEGHRKLASLLQLISNGSLRESAVLFWDEPEANLHPLLASRLVGAIHSLARSGVQIFVATHDYLLADEISLLASSGQGATSRFFSMARREPELAIAESAEFLKDLDENLLLTAISQHNAFRRKIAFEAMGG